MTREQCFFSGAALFVLAVSAAVYVPGLHGPFVFDDMTNILQLVALRITELSVDSLLQAWNAREQDTFIGRPLAMLSFALNYYFAKFDVFYFKITNVVIHLMTGAALFWLTVILLRRDLAVDGRRLYQQRHLPWLALAICATWLLHPLNLTSVLYVVQRMTSLSALFVVAGLIGYCHGRQQIIAGRKLGFATILVSLPLFGALSTLCKENGVLLWPLVALVEVAFYRFAAHPNLAILFKRFWLALIALPMLLGLLVVFADYERWFSPHAYRFRDFTLEERLLTQTRVIWLYLRLLFLPDIARMGIYHDDFPTSHGLLEPVATLLSLIGIAALLAVAVIARTRAPILFFAIAWFLIGHSMESTALALEMIHEHRNYLPQYGLLFALVYFVCAPYSHHALRRTLYIRLGFMSLFAVLLGVGTHARSVQWQDPFSLFSHEVLNHPESARAHTMLGAWMHNHGFPDRAREHLTIASNLTSQQAEHFIRLVQNIYATNHEIPEQVLDELRYRLTHSRVSGVTLWVYEPLLQGTRDNPLIHDQIIELYELMLLRPEIKTMSEKWMEAGYRLLAENHAHRNRIEVAVSYYRRAAAINPRPYYDIVSASLLAQYGCRGKAREIAVMLRDTHTDLGPNDEQLLRDLETLLTDGSPSAARCTL